ncbi:ABC transporter permease [Burkholderia stagnalis]|uniref:efflux transporter outer membrane subunit n=1 Tax=Burkholderia stagnalis TaxID=1503054 RepID=UPI0007597E26|nr:efflux transporter outer membrane subunit [Burkholderia stagnalis]AOK56145.1 ABC transporter permease [Burkholderia stagnalis]KVN81627.1 ABC transporter permease [Burkholderia stagnalis]KWO27687.1 ABC transporter permease [Burkholderia stagnalis]KWO37365.1 ABC transporter permease [Burkholderia stagnalis]MDY7803482.1 efflux transporter outer membrane subunit [Burkholderia stagnalis]
MSFVRRRVRVTARVASVAALVSGCAVGPDFGTPAAPPTQRYTRGAPPATTASAGGAAGNPQTFATAGHALPRWWTQFGCEPLNRLVDDALKHSPTVDAARAKLDEARQNYVAQAGATQWPSVDAKLSGTREKVDTAAFGLPANVPNPGPFTLYNASVSVSYVLDVFGGNRRALEALRAQVDYQSYELEAARLTLAGNVVATVVRRASLARQLALTQQLADAQARQLRIVEARHAAGGVSTADVHAQRTLLAQTQASLPPLAAQRAQADHRLAILIGMPPAEADLPDVPLDALALPGALPVTLPSTLARERPDIRAAEAVLHQASANVGVATANLYPRFAISAGAGSERTRIADIVNGLNIWNIGLNLTQPLFHGGELRAKKHAAEAAYDAAFADYRQTVLLALQQVADAMRAVEQDAETLRSRDEAAREADASNTISAARYAAGGLGEFGLLDAQRQALQTALDRTRAQADRLADTAALFQALGGSSIAP